MILVTGCGGGGGSSGKQNQGAAAQAVARFFNEERASGQLPEGVDVTQIGTRGFKELTVSAEQKQRKIDERVCVEFAYTGIGTPPQTRVYIATLSGSTWWVEAVKPAGACADVE